MWGVLKSISLCGHIRLVLTKHATGEVRTVWWVFGTSASFTGGTEVLGYHRGVPRYAVRGAQGLGGESSASCINYPGKKPARTQNYQL